MSKKYFKKLIEWKHKKKEDKAEFRNSGWAIVVLSLFAFPSLFNGINHGVYASEYGIGFPWYQLTGAVMGILGCFGIFFCLITFIFSMPRRKKYYVEVKKK